ncbi:Protein CBG27891 [Caenorhabditis briggsae]|uniref:Protein CBG27891 n=1 Tax=Caenorhabditis briggsae TaxID=6238 RepID=B6IEI6_CAEBR|nr:Protein CBG27891 [Caenorhabditis briggsae]CAR98316.1 Protein CBG27891 [Caenorhabditis briggsae]
MRIPMEMGD